MILYTENVSLTTSVEAPGSPLSFTSPLSEVRTAHSATETRFYIGAANPGPEDVLVMFDFSRLSTLRDLVEFIEEGSVSPVASGTWDEDDTLTVSHEWKRTSLRYTVSLFDVDIYAGAGLLEFRIREPFTARYKFHGFTGSWLERWKDSFTSREEVTL